MRNNVLEAIEKYKIVTIVRGVEKNKLIPLTNS